MSSKEFMHDLLQPGETLVIAGKRGHGKTATVMSMAQHAVEGDYGHECVEVVTNVVFGRVTRGDPIEDYPEHVHHEDTLAGTMRRIGEIVREYGPGGCTILWLLDEAQNYMMADENGRKENLALTKYLGNARKFDVCNVFMTPTLNNLTPRVRCFPTGESKSGYCSAQLIKDKDLSIATVGARVDPRSITFVRTSSNGPFQPIYIEPTSWIRGIYGHLPVGSFGYDTKSMATFAIGENDNGVLFSLEDFLKVTSKGLSHELPDKIDEYFDRWEREGSETEKELPGEDYSKIRISDQCRRIERMRDKGLTWRMIADIENEAMTTVQSRFYKFIGRGPSSESVDASILTNDETEGGHAGAYIYNPKRGRGPETPGSSEGGGLRCSGGRRSIGVLSNNRTLNRKQSAGRPGRNPRKIHGKVGGNVHGRRSAKDTRHQLRLKRNRLRRMRVRR